MGDLCRSCGAPIIWTLTAKGKHMPVDAEPVEGGNVHLLLVKVPGEESRIDAVHGPRGTHVSHFATCPQRQEWRRGTTKERPQ